MEQGLPSSNDVLEFNCRIQLHVKSGIALFSKKYYTLLSCTFYTKKIPFAFLKENCSLLSVEGMYEGDLKRYCGQ